MPQASSRSCGLPELLLSCRSCGLSCLCHRGAVTPPARTHTHTYGESRADSRGGTVQSVANMMLFFELKLRIVHRR